MTIDLRVSEGDWTALRKQFSSSFRSGFPPETGAIGLVGESCTIHRQELLLAKVCWPQPGDITTASNGALVFGSGYLRRAHLAMRAQRLTGLVTFHTHPGADRSVDFSPFDDCQDPLLIENLIELEPQTRLLSVVVGKSSQRARVWSTPVRSQPLDRLFVLGETFAELPLTGQPAAPVPSPAALFDSALSLTGEGALARLARLTVAVVGVSGTGSLVAELLLRAGCKHLLLIDDDITEVRNLNRILHARQRDATRREPKVAVVRRGLVSAGLGCRVDIIRGSVLDRDVLARLRDADVIVGCVDQAYPRQLLGEFAFQYLRPYIDVGTEIGGDEQGIVALNARVNYVAPGRPCLQCTGLVTARQLRFESLSFQERQREIALGYSDDLVLKQPAVMDLNMRAASLGALLLRHLLQPFLLQPLPVTIMENVVTYTILAQHQARAASPTCSLCQRNSAAGYGDCGPALGLTGASLEAVLGPRPADEAD